jgi:N-acetylglucosamine kinase-like BadF-type ATPase
VLEWYSPDAGLAPQIFELAYAGDQAARDVIEWAGRELGGMAAGVIHQIEIEQQSFEVVLVGSVWEGGPLIREPMQQTVLEVAPQARFTRLAAPPVTGALLLGMEAAGLDAGNPAIRQNLLATAGSR